MLIKCIQKKISDEIKATVHNSGPFGRNIVHEMSYAYVCECVCVCV